MRDLDQTGVTEAVIRQMAGTADPRLREVMESLVRHLHDFARDVSLSPDEWLRAIAFLTQVGQACTAHRQEFILLSDVLGLSRLINVLDDAEHRVGEATETSLLGPFYRDGAPEIPFGGAVTRAIGDGGVIYFGRILNEAGHGVPHAQLEVWHTNEAGQYDLQSDEPQVMDMRARLRADDRGDYVFRSVLPLGYSIPMDGPVGALVRHQGRHGKRPAHLHTLVTAPGYRDLVTALYLGSDPNIDSDTVFGVSDSLVVEPRLGLEGSPRPDLPGVHYDFRIARLEEGAVSARVGADPASLMRAAE